MATAKIALLEAEASKDAMKGKVAYFENAAKEFQKYAQYAEAGVKERDGAIKDLKTKFEASIKENDELKKEKDTYLSKSQLLDQLMAPLPTDDEVQLGLSAIPSVSATEIPYSVNDTF